jgi:hypothetical protein
MGAKKGSSGDDTAYVMVRYYVDPQDHDEFIEEVSHYACARDDEGGGGEGAWWEGGAVMWR